MRKFWKWFFVAWQVFGDSLIVYFSFWIAFETRFFCPEFLKIFPALKGIPPWRLYQDALRVVIPLWVLIAALWGRMYSWRFSDAADDFMTAVKTAGLAIALILAVTFLYRRYEYSRLVIGLGCCVSTLLIFLSREIWKAAVRSLLNSFSVQENVVLIAQGKIAKAVGKRIEKDPHRTLLNLQPQNLADVKQKMGSGLVLHEVVVQGQFLGDISVQEFLELCEEKGIEIKILPDFLEMRMGEILVDDSLGLPILHLKPLSLHGLKFWMKRIFDLGASIVIVSLLFIPFLIVSLLIVMDSPGGVFFVQDRMGFKERIFKCMKFRTMFKDADVLIEKMNLASFRGGPAFKMKGDPRITRVGKILRKFSMDEMPQIWNVLKGEMSLIGPRPQVLAEANGNLDWARKRYRILPGITGLWQVSGRADLTYEDMMRLDIFYLENWSPGLDLKILLKTLPVILSSKGAY